MRPNPMLIGRRSQDDTERIEGAVKAVEQILGPLMDEYRSLAEAVVGGFILAEKPSSTMPVGLTTSRGQLEKLEKAAQALASALEAVTSNPSLVGSLYRYGFDPGTQEYVEELPLIARQVLRDLPARKKWAKEYVPRRELVSGLATLFEGVTGEKATSGIRHNREPELYHGRFFDLVSGVLYELDTPDTSNTALGRLIVDVLP